MMYHDITQAFEHGHFRDTYNIQYIASYNSVAFASYNSAGLFSEHIGPVRPESPDRQRPFIWPAVISLSLHKHCCYSFFIPATRFVWIRRCSQHVYSRIFFPHCFSPRNQLKIFLQSIDKKFGQSDLKCFMQIS